MGFTRSVPVEVECGAVGSFELGVFKQTFAYRDRIGTRGKDMRNLKWICKNAITGWFFKTLAYNQSKKLGNDPI